MGGEEGLGLESNPSAALCLGSAIQKDTRMPSGLADTDKGGGQQRGVVGDKAIIKERVQECKGKGEPSSR